MEHGLFKATLRKSLVIGADKLILLEDKAYQDLDSYATDFILAGVIIGSLLRSWKNKR
jgi:electron transfer flavoprotein alpha/beta subunit